MPEGVLKNTPNDHIFNAVLDQMKRTQTLAINNPEEHWDEKAGDGWEVFRTEEFDHISVDDLKQLNISEMPEDIRVLVLDNYFPETTVTRDGQSLVCEITEHLYTKYWEHKFSAYAFAEAMERAVIRLAQEGHPIGQPTRDDEDVHIFVRWQLRIQRDSSVETLVESIRSCFDLVWHRADAILANSDSVLVLGKDTGASLAILQQIAAALRKLGYYTYIIKEEPDKVAESVIQKVMRYALSSKFVVIENTAPSGHLYEIPHVTKTAECITVVLQEQGKGATWMFEDAYGKHRHLHKIEYATGELDSAVTEASKWAEEFVDEFAAYQAAKLPWLK